MLGSVSNAEDIQWTGLGADQLWSTPENWDLGRVPTLADEVRIDVPAAAAPNGPVIPDGIDAKAKGIFTEAPGEPTLTMTGGTLEVAEWIWWGDGTDSFGIWTMSGGTVSVVNEFELGWGGGAGTLIMTGGTINAGEAVIPTGSGAFGELLLHGGTYNVTKPGELKVNATGLIDVTEGTLVLEGDDTAKVNDLIAAGQITAYGGAGLFKLDYDDRNPGKTTLSASAQLIAYEPFDYPANGLSGNDGGSGWNGAWDGGDQQVTAPGLVFSPLLVKGNKATVVGGDSFRDLPEPIGDNETQLWISFVGQADQQPGADMWGGVSFHEPDESLFLGVPWQAGDGDKVWGLDTKGDGNRFTDIPITEKIILIARVDFNTDGDNETVTAWARSINDTGPLDLTDETAFAQYTTRNIEFSRVRVAGNQPVNIDEIRLSMTPETRAFERAVLFAEDFEGLALGPNVDEELAGDAVWTDTPPDGWSIDESGIPGIGLDATDGVTEWAGWAFTDKEWWIAAAEDQDRSLFELGIGTVAVADPDEWDDAERLPIPISADPYDTWLSTPAIDIAGAEAGTLELKFDSSWRPEFDDNYHQTANITASFDGGEPVVVMLWESDESSANYKPYATNETVIVNLDNPAEAKKLVLTFGLFDAGNDWWWAIDNVEVSGVLPEPEPVNPGTAGLVAYYPLDIDVLDASGNGNDGTVNGDPTFVDGMVGTAMEFDGNGDFVDCGNNPILALTDAVSISAWIKVAVQGADHKVGGNQDGANGGYKMSVYNDKIEFEIRTAGNSAVLNRSVAGGTVLEVGVWYHVTGVYSLADGYIRTYVNGELDRELETTEALGASPGSLMIGCEPFSTGQYNFNGVMDDIHLYNKALSEGEVMYLAGKRVEPVDPGTDGLVAFYALDGDANDSSGNELHGTIVGEPTFVEGQVGMALELDGLDDYVDIGNPSLLDFGTGDFTISAWINMTAIERGTVYAKGGDNSGGIRYTLAMGEGNDNKMTLTTDDDSSKRQALGGTVVNDGAWHHVVGMRSGSTSLVYVDGDKDGTIDLPEGYDLSGSTQHNALLGVITSHTDGSLEKYFAGLIDEVAIYGRALSAGEIRYLAGERAVDPSLVIYYSFDEVSDIIADQSGKGHDGVVNGDITAEANGKYNGAANFASGSYLDLDGPNFAAEDIPTSGMTLAAWIKCTNTGDHHALFNARASDETWVVHPEARSNGEFRWLLRSYGGTTMFDIRAGAVTWDEWLHFAGTYDKASGKAALCINGELVSEVDVASPADIAGDWGMGARVGYNIDNARPFTGLMDEFRMYTRALSQDEILEIMQGM